MSQGLLQSIFEYQTMICELTGMDVSNASVYDGATAAAEAAAMCRERKRRVTLISGAAHPDTINTVRTYCYGTGDELRVVPVKDGRTDMDALREMLDDGVASLLCAAAQLLRPVRGRRGPGPAGPRRRAPSTSWAVNPIALAIMKTPRDCGADIAVGEGQPLGLPLGCGGPYLGYMAATDKLMRKLPGRIVGETTDDQGQPGLCPEPAGPGAAHPPGEGQQQHLLQRGPVRPDGRRCTWPPWVPTAWRRLARAVHGQGPLSGKGAVRPARRGAGVRRGVLPRICR